MFFAAPDAAPAAEMAVRSVLLLLIVIIPMLAGILLYLPGEKREATRKALSLAAAFFALAGTLWLLPAVLAGTVEYSLVNFMQLGLFFRLDLAGWIFACIIALVWFLATLFSWAYMDLEHNRRRYYSFLIFTLGATLGVVCARDFFTLFLFFELMTFSSFVLVIHEQDRQAMQAGALYLYLGVAGGLALLFAVMLLFATAGTVEIRPLLEQITAHRTLIFILFMIGFGIKAGLVPLHIWLPQAHPVAPSPASALLSGIMIKAGAYGIFRVLLVLYAPAEHASAADWAYLANLGWGLLWIGIATMFLGALMALLQSNAKRILAYSSVSQIGYIAMGLGAAAFEGLEGGMGFSGAVYHIINHAFFKAGLFMMVGTIFMYTRELELPRLGGMARKMPLVALSFLVAAFGIAGIPGFNGFPSKTLLHDSLLIAYKHYHYFGIDLAEKIFTLTSALTICYFTKLYRGLFLGPVPAKLDREYRLPVSVNLVLGAFALIITAIGLFPNQILEQLIYPAAVRLGYEGYAMDHLAHFNFFAWEMLKPMVIVVVLAAVIYIPGALRGWFNWQPPRWLSIHALVYRPLAQLLMAAACRGGSMLELGVNTLYDRSSSAARQMCRHIGDFDAFLDYLYQRSGEAARGLAEHSSRMDRALDQAYSRTGRAARRLVDRTGDLDQALDQAYARTGRVARRLVYRASDLDQALDEAYAKTGRAARRLVDRTGDLDQALDEAYARTGRAARHLVDRTGALDHALDEAYVKSGRAARKLVSRAGYSQEKPQDPGLEIRQGDNRFQWSIKNLNFDTLLLAAVLGVVLFVIFYYGGR